MKLSRLFFFLKYNSQVQTARSHIIMSFFSFFFSFPILNRHLTQFYTETVLLHETEYPALSSPSRSSALSLIKGLLLALY